jgi:hypothetical protein
MRPSSGVTALASRHWAGGSQVSTLKTMHFLVNLEVKIRKLREKRHLKAGVSAAPGTPGDKQGEL